MCAKCHFALLVFVTCCCSLSNTTKSADLSDFDYGDVAHHHPIIRRPVIPHLTSSSNAKVQPEELGSRYLRRRKPGQKSRDPSLLMELMSEDFEAFWMSVEEPTKLSEVITSNEVLSDEIAERWATDRLAQQLGELNLTEEFAGTELGSDPKIHSAIREWLLRRASCPIEFTWQDLGPMFWPKWVRKGDCVDKEGTCSWPPGMHCVPAATTTVHILRWQCREKRRTHSHGDRSVELVSIGGKRDKVKKKRRKCQWTKVPFPITIDCFCTC